jgi:uncharacterized protein with FMN-binding domain
MTMRRIVVAFAATVSGLVLLFSYHTSTNQGSATVASAGVIGAPPAQANPNGTSGTSGSSGSGTGGSGTGGSGGTNTVTGGAADTPFGPVQVQITVANGKIVSAKTVQVPMETSHDQRINTQAVPILNQEAVSAQSAHIDTVSGATYTSEGYSSSLQSAIDAAHLSG